GPIVTGSGRARRADDDVLAERPSSACALSAAAARHLLRLPRLQSPQPLLGEALRSSLGGEIGDQHVCRNNPAHPPGPAPHRSGAERGLQRRLGLRTIRHRRRHPRHRRCPAPAREALNQMSLALLFWILMLIWVIFGFAQGWGAVPGPYGLWGHSILLFFLL